MKKLLFALTLVLCLAVSLVAFTSCGGDGGCEHIWATEATVDTAATCTQEGSQSIKCTACGETKADSVTAIPATGHAYDEGTTVAATCTEDGSVTKTCATCGDVNVTTIAATGHAWAEEATVDTAATCTTDGSKSIKCTVCTEVKPESTEAIPAPGHTWADEATVDTEATCMTDGQKSVKCVVCETTNPDSIEVIPSAGQHVWADDIDVTLPTLFADGIKTGTCSVCAEALSETLPKTEPVVEVFTPGGQNGTTVDKYNIVNDVLKGDHFYPTEENPNGKSLYLEFSFLWNETLGDIDNGGDYYVQLGALGNNGGSERIAPYFLIFRSGADMWCQFPGGFETDNNTTNVYGPAVLPDLEADAYTYIGEYGWHRVGIEYTQTAEIVNGAVEYTLYTTLYIDGVKVLSYKLLHKDNLAAHDSKNRGTNNLLYTATIVNGELEYDDIADTRYIYAYRFGNNKKTIGDDNAYFVVGDISATCGTDFAQKVTKLDTPVEGTYSPAEGVELDADRYFAYEQPTPDVPDYYEYPMDQVVGTDGAIIYWGTGDQKNAYLTEADGKAVGYYKNAFIDLTNLPYNYVTIVSNGTKKAGWAFITEMPEVGEKVTYVGNFEILNKFAWCVDATGYAKVEIPEGAKYLVLYYEEAGNSYCPASITFTNDDKVGTDAYEYPMENVTPIEGYINHSGTSSNNKAHYLRYKENDERYAFIDLTDLDYNTVTLYAPTNGEATNYTFLTKIPTEDSEQVSYAIGYSDCVWYGLGNGAMTVTIPDNATCLAVLCNYYNQTDTMPEAIVFSNRESNPSEMLKNDTLDTYEYPMTEVNASMGTIRGSDGVFILNRQWVAGFVSIEGTVFNKVVFEIDETYGKICYGFLAEYPTLNETVTWAGGATGTTTVTNENGSTVEAWIPADAKVLVVYWNDWDNGAPVYYVPDSITFVKADCDHSEAKVTVITTPTLFSEGECEGTCPICGEDLGGTLAKTEANSYIVTNTLGGAYLIKESERLGDVLGEDEHFYPTEEHPNGQSLYIEFSILLNDSMNNFTNSNISFPGIYTSDVLSSKRGHSAFWFYMWKADGITKGTCDDWTSNSIKSLGYYNEQFALEFDGWHRIGVEFHQNDNIDYETFEITSTMTVTMYYDGVKVYEATLGNGSKAPEEEILLYTAEFVGDDIVYTERVDSHAAYMSYDAYIKDAANPCYIILADQYVSVGTNGFVLDVDRVDNPEAEDYTVAEGVTLSGKVYFEIATETEDTEDAEDAETTTPGGSTDSEDAETTTPGGSTDSEDAETTTPGGSTDSEDAETTTPTNPGFGSASDAEESENAGTTTPPIFSTPDSEDAA